MFMVHNCLRNRDSRNEPLTLNNFLGFSKLFKNFLKVLAGGCFPPDSPVISWRGQSPPWTPSLAFDRGGQTGLPESNAFFGRHSVVLSIWSRRPNRAASIKYLFFRRRMTPERAPRCSATFLKKLTEVYHCRHGFVRACTPNDQNGQGSSHIEELHSCSCEWKNLTLQKYLMVES